MKIVHTVYERRDYLSLMADYREVKKKGVFGWMVLCIEIFDGDEVFIQKNVTQNATYMKNRRHIYTKYENTDSPLNSMVCTLLVFL